MHLAVLGATGRTGRLIVEMAQARGHIVTALTRRSKRGSEMNGTTKLDITERRPQPLSGGRP